jgi:hypothetical protein
MRGNAFTNAGDTIANAKLIYLRTDCGHYPGAAIPKRSWRPQTFLDLTYCRPKALFPQRLYDLFDLIGPFTRLSGKIHSRLGHLHFLGPHADERIVRANKNLAGTHTREGNLAGFHGTAQ